MVTRRVVLLMTLASLATAGPRSARSRDIQLGDEADHTEKVAVGDKLRLRCNFVANISWHKDGAVLRSRSPQLKITKQAMRFKAVQLADAGRYACCIKLEDSTEQCHSITLMVYDTTAHADFLQDMAAAHVPGVIERREDVPTAGDSYSYELDPTRQLDNADVMLRANMTAMSLVHEEDTSGNENDQPTGANNETLHQMAPRFTKPNIMTHAVIKPAGSTVHLSCPAEGNPKPHITWKKDGDKIDHSDRWSLKLENLSVHDIGNYTCFVCNSLACINFVFEVDMIEHHQYKLNLTDAPQNATVLVGHNVSFHCGVLSGHPYVKWFKGNITSRVNIESRISTDSPEDLVLRNVTFGDEGWYTCVARNSFRETSASAYLHVIDRNVIPLSELGDQEDSNDPETNRVAGEYNETVPQMPPRFTKPGNMNRVVAKPAGNMLRLKCPAEGNPEPNITWTKDGAAPHRNLGHVRYGRWSLILEDLVVSDSGNYMCLVCNLCDCINFTFKVDIVERLHHRPILTEAPKNSTVVVGHNESFRCEVLSDLQPHVEWFRGYYTSLNETETSNVVKSGIPTDTPEELVLSNVSYEDEGWYTCIAGNSLGQAYASAYLHVVDMNLILLSQLSDQEDSNDHETNRVAGEYNETVPQMPPRFTKPGNMNRVVAKPAGNMLRLRCPAEGSPEPNITWTKDGAAPRRNLGHVRYNRWSLTLEDLVVSDSGNYTCLVCNLCDCINFTFKVDIVERYPHPPYIKDGYPRNVTALVNTTATFKCLTDSDLEPHIQWVMMSHKFEDGTDRMEDNITIHGKVREGVGAGGECWSNLYSGLLNKHHEPASANCFFT